MQNIRIFCEGISDQRFLRDFIHINYEIEIKDAELDNYIICLNGWPNLKKYRTRITEELSEFFSIIFLDADDESTPEKNGLIETSNYVDNLMNSWNWKNYDKFIFPNNSEENGEIEDFFENIINPKNKDIFVCWNNFEECLTSKDKKYNIPAKKSKIYMYHEVLHGNSNSEKNKCKDKGRDFKNSDLWELEVKNNDYLKVLKNFLDKYLP